MFSSKDHRSGKFLFGWIFVHLVAWTIGLPVSGNLGWLIYLFLALKVPGGTLSTDYPSHTYEDLFILIACFAAGLLIGAMVGIGQLYILRQSIEEKKKWLLFTVLGWGIGFALGQVTGSLLKINQVGNIVTAANMLLGGGLLSAAFSSKLILIRPSLSLWWIMINGLGYPVVAVIIWSMELFPFRQIDSYFLGVLLLLILFSLLASTITGIAYIRMTTQWDNERAKKEL